jgi:glycosyltransferase involved in cell wall biosynthesis
MPAIRCDLKVAVSAGHPLMIPHTRPTILHVGKFYPPARGGMETVLGQLCAATADRWKVSAVVANKSRKTIREIQDGVEVTRMASIGELASVPLLPTSPFRLWSGKYDCVVLHEPNPLVATILALRTPGRHLVIWHHSDIVRPWWAPLIYGLVQRRLYRRASCVLVSGPRMAEYSKAVRHARRVVMIPYGIDLARYAGLDSGDSDASLSIHAKFEGPITLFVGRLVYYKGLDVLVQAMTKCPGTLALIGEGPLEAGLRRLCTDSGIASRVKFLGHVSDEQLISFYHAADLLVLPSTQPTEAFGLVQVEAMACGLPVVSTDLPTAVPWVNQNGVTGLVVPPGDPDALAAAINRLLEDPALRSRMGEAGRRRAAEQFSAERMVRDFIATIEAVVAS